MKKFLKQRVLPLLLSAALVVSVSSVPVYATGNEGSTDGLCEHHITHTATCYPEDEESEDASPSDAKAEDVEGSPCTYDCDICNADNDTLPDTNDTLNPDAEEACLCESLCTEDSWNGDCLVCCGDLTLCEGGPVLKKAARRAVPAPPAAKAGPARPYRVWQRSARKSMTAVSS